MAKYDLPDAFPEEVEAEAARVPQTVVDRASVPAPVACATRVEDANTSSATRSPAEALRVSFNVPSSGVATAYVRVLDARVTAPARAVVVLPVQGDVTSCSAAATAAADGNRARDTISQGLSGRPRRRWLSRR
jgi:hypothetical protein